MEHELESLAALLTKLQAYALRDDLMDHEKRTPQLYNAVTAFLKSMKIELDPDSNALKEPLGALANKLNEIPLPDKFN